jgi:hypothetical protein
MKHSIFGIYMALILTSFYFIPSTVYAFSMAKVTIKVIDEENKPVESAQIELCFHGGCTNKDIVTGVTDKNGVFTSSGFSSDGVTGGTVNKKGYYYSAFHKDFIISKLGMYQPWNEEIKVLLRPKLDPVPMYVRRKHVKIPYADKNIGFDLIKFDWVAPYGFGSVADFIFHVKRSWDGRDNYESTLTLTFSNKYDGIQTFTLDQGGDFGVGSLFRTPRYAPDSGYQNKLVTRLDSNAVDLHAYVTTDTFHFFRIRSEVDKNGKLKRAMYGKMQGRLKADPRDTGNAVATIELYYWLNPDYTHNLEFDGDKNLFSPLPAGESIIRIP